jgi:hypothetical protein
VLRYTYIACTVGIIVLMWPFCQTPVRERPRSDVIVSCVRLYSYLMLTKNRLKHVLTI